MRVFLLIVAIVVVLVVVILIRASLKPARFTIQRSIVIHAPREKVFALINDLRRWQEWSESGSSDSAVKRAYSGAVTGKGAVYEWEGRGNQGKGHMEITESSPSLIRVQADWARPFAARNINIFTLEPQPQSGDTRVSWALDGENVFVLKVMTVFVSIDRLMGSHFEKGLAGLKTAAEKQDASLTIPIPIPMTGTDE